MKTSFRGNSPRLSLSVFALGASLVITTVVRAADHADGPRLAADAACDLGDLYVFADPTDNSKVVLIGTFRGFVAAGENANFGVFDPAVQYRFEIENTGDARPDKFIDVTFSKREADPGPAGKEILQVPRAQTATIKITGLKGSFNAPATNPSLANTAPAPVITELTNSDHPDTNIDFVAGLFDDPFYFDIPAFSRFIGSVRAGSPDTTHFNRARDSFAGYNTLAIAIRIPAETLRGSSGAVLGASIAARRHLVESQGKTGDIKGRGAYKNVDRTGVPAVNVALIPFNRKNEYNAASPQIDATGRFANDIVATLQALGTVLVPGDNNDNIDTLAAVAVANGDILRLDTSIPNTGSGGGDNVGAPGAPAGFPNGRRLRDDVIDIELTLIANGNPFTGTGVLSDNVDANDVPLTDTFPFLAPPQQPRVTGVTDDNTRN